MNTLFIYFKDMLHFSKQPVEILAQKAVVVAEKYLNNRGVLTRIYELIDESPKNWEIIMKKMNDVEVRFYPLKKVKSLKKLTTSGAADRHSNTKIIWLNRVFKDRVEFANLNEDSYEYKIIVTILGITILHECAHMFLRWLGVTKSPDKFRGEVGNFFETMIFGSPICVLGKKEKADSPWTKEVEIKCTKIY
jgi:hypothetical protein